MKKYIVGVVLILLILLMVFGGYYIYSSNHSQNATDILKEKADLEISYLDTTIISMMNKLNNISYENYRIVEEAVPREDSNTQTTSGDGQSGDSQKSGSSGGSGGGEDASSEESSNTITNMNMNYSSILVNPNRKIDWDQIKKETEKMYQTWNTVLIDLNSLNINQDNLLKYSSTLDELTKAVQKEEKKTTLYRLADLYTLLATYIKEYSSDNEQIVLLEVKSNILYAYALVEDSNWQDMQNYIKKAQNAYNNMINSTLQNNGNITNINKAYVMLNEIYKSTDTKDKSIFYINYKNLMQELEILEH